MTDLAGSVGPAVIIGSHLRVPVQVAAGLYGIGKVVNTVVKEAPAYEHLTWSSEDLVHALQWPLKMMLEEYGHLAKEIGKSDVARYSHEYQVLAMNELEEAQQKMWLENGDSLAMVPYDAHEALNNAKTYMRGVGLEAALAISRKFTGMLLGQGAGLTARTLRATLEGCVRIALRGVGEPLAPIVTSAAAELTKLQPTISEEDRCNIEIFLAGYFGSEMPECAPVFDEDPRVELFE